MNVAVTAGPTREAIDPVRFLSNRSSGRMGFAIAETAARQGHSVRLIAGPVTLQTPPFVERIDVESAEDMYRAVAAAVPWAQAMILAAAVADFRPAAYSPLKTPKDSSSRTLLLEPAPDILGSLRHPLGFSGFLAGFAAETHDLEEHARKKLLAKDCDLIVANEVGKPGAGFDSPDNAVLLLFRSGRILPLPLASKTSIAASLWQAVEEAITQVPSRP
ncbi:MAG TPA: phosphopantothenoylcysteine decarboxylase [Verrucomicrobiales bacterium]|nr:phosphopantothenoylcysteine decarboxylase [Verrucomicrobiales bacterium]